MIFIGILGANVFCVAAGGLLVPIQGALALDG